MSFPHLDQLIKTSACPWDLLPRSFGDKFTCSNGQVIVRGQEVPLSSQLPVLLHPTKVVVGDLIPHTSWGASLANLLTKSSWDKLRHPLIEASGNACQLCGNGTLRSYDVHEIWSYQMPSPQEVEQARQGQSLALGVQTLEGLLVLCTKCHACFHLGGANAQNRLSSVLSRLRIINNWSASQLGLYKRLVFQRWEHHNQVPWILDFSNLTHPDGGLTISSSWQELDMPGLFLRSGQITAISGISWRFPSTKTWSPGVVF